MVHALLLILYRAVFIIHIKYYSVLFLAWPYVLCLITISNIIPAQQNANHPNLH